MTSINLLSKDAIETGLLIPSLTAISEGLTPSNLSQMIVITLSAHGPCTGPPACPTAPITASINLPVAVWCGNRPGGRHLGRKQLE